jgi:ribose transport system substrate-binding protein
MLVTSQNIEFIRQGRVQVANAAFDNFYMGWPYIDQAIRVLNKQPRLGLGQAVRR